MVCAHCGAELTALAACLSPVQPFGDCNRSIGLLRLPRCRRRPTPHPAATDHWSRTRTQRLPRCRPESRSEPDTHARPAIVTCIAQPTGGVAAAADAGVGDGSVPNGHAVRAPLPSHSPARRRRHGRGLSGVGRGARGRGRHQGHSAGERRPIRRRRGISSGASNASCCSPARSRTRTSSASTTSARSTASSTSRCRTCTGRTSRPILKREAGCRSPRALSIARQVVAGSSRRTRPASCTAI